MLPFALTRIWTAVPVSDVSCFTHWTKQPLTWPVLAWHSWSYFSVAADLLTAYLTSFSVSTMTTVFFSFKLINIANSSVLFSWLIPWNNELPLILWKLSVDLVLRRADKNVILLTFLSYCNSWTVPGVRYFKWWQLCAGSHSTCVWLWSFNFELIHIPS